jgi:hypothetical protein
MSLRTEAKTKDLPLMQDPIAITSIDTDPALVTCFGKTPLATHILDHPEHVDLGHNTDKSLEASTDPLNTIDIDTDPALATHLGKTSVTTRLLNHPEHINRNYGTNKALETTPRDTHVEPLPIARLPQPGKPVTPTLWLAFALSSIVLLLGTVMLYALVPLRSPAASKPLKSQSAKTAPAKSATTHVTPTPQSTVHKQIASSVQSKQASVNRPPVSSPPTAQLVQVQPSLAGNYVSQNQTYNLTNEGTLDWIDWGLNTPQDVNQKASVPQQISNFTVIGNSTVQRDSYYSNSNIEWFDGTPQPDTASSQTWGVYVAGINNGFSITVPASTTPRTLRVYVGAKLARGEFTASLDGKTFTDATLDMTDDPNSTEANSIYTVVFNGSAANQVLTVRYTAIATNGSNSYVMLQAATLQ